MIAFVGMQKRRHGNNANISAKNGIITHTLAIATLKRGLSYDCVVNIVLCTLQNLDDEFNQASNCDRECVHE